MITNPLEVPKLRMQIQRAEKSQGSIDKISSGRFGYKNVFHGIYKIFSEEGLLSLWKGSSARVLHMSAQAAINLTLLEQFRQYLLNNMK